MESEKHDIKTNIELNVKRSLPFLVKLVSYFFLIYGIINTVYYSVVLVYSFVNPEFLKDLEYYSFHDKWLLFPVILKIIIDVILIWSAVKILKKDPKGITVFIFVLLISIFFSFFFLKYVNWPMFIIAIFAFLIIWAKRKSL